LIFVHQIVNEIHNEDGNVRMNRK